jgi:hypothetical protein
MLGIHQLYIQYVIIIIIMYQQFGSHWIKMTCFLDENVIVALFMDEKKAS